MLRRPLMYPSAMEYEEDLRHCLWTFAFLESSVDEYSRAKEMHFPADVSTYGTVARSFWKLYYPPDSKPEVGCENVVSTSHREASMYIAEVYRKIAEALGVRLDVEDDLFGSE